MNDWLTTRLHDGAEAATSPVLLDNPGQVSDAAATGEVSDPVATGECDRGPSGDVAVARVEVLHAGRRHQRLLSLAVAAAVVALLAGALTWVGLRDGGSQVVDTPPVPTTTTPIPDPETAPAEVVIADAIQRTLATSWVAEWTQAADMSEDRPTPLTSRVTYQPPDPERGSPRSTFHWVADDPLGEPGEKMQGVMPGSGEDVIYVPCRYEPLPCRAGKWYSLPLPSMASYRATEEAYLGGLTGLDATTARREGTSAVFLVDMPLMCGPVFQGRQAAASPSADAEVSCPVATVEVSDGHVVRMSVSSAEETNGMGPDATWTYSSFGSAPAIGVPEPADVVHIPAESATTICRIVVTVDSSADTAVIEGEAREWIEANGRDLSLDADRAITALPGVSGVSYVSDDGCEAWPVEISFDVVD